MTFSELIDSLVHDTLRVSLPLYGPELALCATIVVMLLARVISRENRIDAFYIALAGSIAGLWLSAPWEQLDTLRYLPRQELFTGLLVYDSFTIYFRAILLLFAVLFVIFTRLSGIPDREDAADFYTLVLGATVGMCLMATANHLVIIFLGVEMASVPSYALAGMLKGRPRSSEAALKYAVYGAGAAGVMLYGISLLGGVLGTCHLPTMAERLADVLAAGQMTDRYMVMALGGLMIGVGLAFKLSAVPFHFWCPDVFEGASAEVNAFLSVASKAAALALLIRVVVGFGAVQPHPQPDGGRVATIAATQDSHQQGNVQLASLETRPVAQMDAAIDANFERMRALAPVRDYIALLVAVISAVTCTFGNLAAYGQTNIKRLMAYSTIAHAGYIMMPVAAGVALMGYNNDLAESVLAAVPFYVGLYLFMNLGAFAIIALVRNEIRSEEIADYGGLVRVAPGIVVCFVLILISLIGIPPLSGFAAKYVAFAALVQAMEVPSFRWVMLTLLVVGGLNTVLSLFYYVRVIKAMTIEPEPEQRRPAELPLVSLRGAYIVAITLPVLVLGLFWDPFYHWLTSGAGNLM